MADLVEWLEEQLRSDERVANAELESAAACEYPESLSGDDVVLVGVNGYVLRTIAAHRAILDEYVEQQRRREENSAKYVRLMRAPARVKEDEGLTGVTTHGWELKGRLDALHHSVLLLAAIYESRPGYREEWKP